MESHTEIHDRIHERTKELSDNWWPFIQNIEDILTRMAELETKIDSYDNRVGEAYGLAKSITKALNKLGLYDDDLHLKWKSVKKLNEVLGNEEK